jgi:hypothetical protein
MAESGTEGTTSAVAETVATPGARIEALDAVRGFALWGIVLVNIYQQLVFGHRPRWGRSVPNPGQVRLVVGGQLAGVVVSRPTASLATSATTLVPPRRFIRYAGCLVACCSRAEQWRAAAEGPLGGER